MKFLEADKKTKVDYFTIGGVTWAVIDYDNSKPYQDAVVYSRNIKPTKCKLNNDMVADWFDNLVKMQ